MEMCPNQMISTLILLHVMVNRVSQCVDIRIFLVKGESRDGERGEDEENVLEKIANFRLFAHQNRKF